ncbi:membrane-associated phospholipid phosphatase [Halobacteroides halobius DSM 5150]|uniref:Membrane-associated phospholipid phosphatase n=1 Tax=Halobacteroides halobius (strain ATCC 35273 / DSM 5150 / MD-1) TaxID=748449 RepID=L0KCI8_HALHC|nr:phosphatase PAP2 family protein [Halobacteroides halobius]AGB42265.1 membrane-associated phospholipid phosphatase [Halobacteroides halobius DSM 5150]
MQNIYLSKFNKITAFLLVVISSVLIFSPLAKANLDEVIRDRVQATDTGFVDSSMQAITYLGDGAVDTIIASALPDEEAKYDAYKSLLVGGLSVFTLKSIIGKKRPPGPIEYNHFTLDSKYHAFPSGHTTTAFALATIIAEYYPDYKYLSYGLATLVGISRLYEDRHWFSDVVAGAGLGYASAKFVKYKW